MVRRKHAKQRRSVSPVNDQREQAAHRHTDCVVHQFVIDGESGNCTACGCHPDDHSIRSSGSIYTYDRDSFKTVCSKAVTVGGERDVDLGPAYIRLSDLLSNVETVPTADTNVKDRVVLVAADGQKFFTHAAIVCASSPVLHAYYHGGNNGNYAGKEVFDLPEADATTVGELLKYIYIHTQPELKLKSFLKLMKLAHFLQVEDFEEIVKETVSKFKEQKLLTARNWVTLLAKLLHYEYRGALNVILGFAKPDDDGDEADGDDDEAVEDDDEEGDEDDDEGGENYDEDEDEVDEDGDEADGDGDSGPRAKKKKC